MVGKVLKCLAGISFIVFMLSCTKIPTDSESDLEMKKLPLADILPAQWGDLVAVTSADENSRYVQLWFQDKEGNIYLVGFNVARNKFASKYRYIKRG